MQEALKAFPVQKRGMPPSGLIVDGNSMYFSEFPPGQAVTRVGIDAKPASQDAIGDLINSLSGSTPTN
jgi:penicillin-binding protein 1A